MLQLQDPTFRVAPLERSTTLRTLAYDTIKQAITTTDLYADAGEVRLDERRIARDLGISRTPVREALMLLEQEGFVRAMPRRRTLVVRKTKREIIEIITVWAALEGLAAYNAAQNAEDAELASLGETFEGLSPSERPDHLQAYARANLTFHETITRLGGCNLMTEMISHLFLHVRAVRVQALHQDARVECSMHEHAAIIVALRARDGERAAILVRDHALGLAAHVAAHWHLPDP